MSSLRIPIRLRRPTQETTEKAREGEPISCSVPVPRGVLSDARDLRLELRLDGGDGQPIPAQFRILEAWPDGSVRWLRLHWLAGDGADYVLLEGADEAPAIDNPLRCQKTGDEVEITSAAGTLQFVTGSEFPCRGWDARMEYRDAAGATRAAIIERVRLGDHGPLRAEIHLAGTFEGADAPCFDATIVVHASLPVLGISFTLHNPRAAHHAGGLWELGDPASERFRGLRWRAPRLGGAHDLGWSTAPGEAWRSGNAPAKFSQHSSAGPFAASPVHMDAAGNVPTDPKSGEVETTDGSESFARLKPVVTCRGPDSFAALTLPRFWEEFPKAIEAAADGLTLHLWPELDGERCHELQGGEKKTHAWTYAFGEENVAGEPLLWAREPSLAVVDPSWNATAVAWSYLTPDAEIEADDRAEYFSETLEGSRGLFAKREAIDEYGWRHFGDIWADHEATQSDRPESFVSHYNNQYDVIEGLLVRFLSNGDPRWFELGDDLARHVADIDRYHTDDDKAAYNGGLFWHTAHYTAAGKATHRTYPNAPGVAGGGPSNEHNYTSGFLLHHLLTGSESSRDAVIGLADWVIAMDDGRRAPLAALDQGPTGLASQTAFPDYHGPGRGAGNSINALVDAHRLTGRAEYLAKADELVHRCIHPDDDIAGRDLMNREGRWSYTVFLFKLSKYLRHREQLGLVDGSHDYARESLLRYARWMADNEFPYLDRPEDLDFPTETWAAQELRKSDVYYAAARFAQGAERERFLEQGARYHKVAFEHLQRFDTRFLTRPLVLVLTCGAMHAAVTTKGPGEAPERSKGREAGFAPLIHFVDRKARLRRKAKAIVVAGAVVCVLLAALLVAWLL
ncbi:MAG: RIFT barrel domain-containing protein [Planctomycetota bacterium]|jgi:hypothetical protein